MSDEQVRITGLEVHIGHTSHRNLTLVKLTTDAGIVGWGEATLVMREHAVRAHLEFLERLVVGADALAPADVWRRICEEDFFMRSDIVGRAAVAGVMIACADITGKAWNVPVYRLLGGPYRDRIPVYANGWFKGERSPDSYAKLAKSTVARGYRALKLDPFGALGMLATERDAREGLELVEAIVDAVGPDVVVYVDVHGRFAPATAAVVIDRLADIGVGFVEEPIAPDDFDGLRALREHARVPIAAGERSVSRYDYRPLIEGRAADIVQPDITWVGGLLEAQRIASWAETHQMLVSIHNCNGPMSTITGCHLAAAIPNLLRHETWDDFDDDWVRGAFPGRPDVVDGCLPLPTGPGLGLEPDEDALAEHPFRPVFLNLSAENWEQFDAVLD